MQRRRTQAGNCRCSRLSARRSPARRFSPAFCCLKDAGAKSSGTRTSIWTQESIPFLPSLPREAAQLVLIERDTEAGPGGQVDPEIREAQRLLDEIVDEDLWAETFAAPGQP